MRKEIENIEPMVYESGISVPYHWWAGETASRFFTSIRDHQTILGTRCDACGKVFVPPRKSCPVCFESATAWVEVSDTGRLKSFTVARRQLAALPGKAPIIYGLIQLDGADTAILHFLGEVDPRDLKIGMRLKAMFQKERKGNILDIAYFKPADQ